MSGSKQVSKEDSLEKKRVKRLTDAFLVWAKEDPNSFREVAPDLLRQGVNRATGHDPKATRRLEYWLLDEWKSERFEGLLEFNHEIKSDNNNSDNFNINRFKGINRIWLDTLEDKFHAGADEHSGTFRRWPRHVRDQFIILGMIVQEKEGVTQGDLARNLGIQFEDEASRSYAANVIRAAKIALTRLAKNSANMKEGIFGDAKGNGLNRRHSFESDQLRKLTLRWIESHPAKVLVPLIQ
ncbi:MAG TPA: hypothetical protein QF802_07055 [Candidatus Thalassarchaeaceae archaeon]|nr:hypothetical protein [Candidatus Poseidoniaceae archaeon]HJM20196.1 hypothetical protein [Candidatus Thalassarchaeaceae archaeon]HJM87253.1 hypothetical protein [Candidatus Thalassarchaeaceae archaeon]